MNAGAVSWRPGVPGRHFEKLRCDVNQPLLRSKGLKEAQLDAGGAEVIRQSAQRGGGGGEIQRTPPKNTQSRTIQTAYLRAAVPQLLAAALLLSPVRRTDICKARGVGGWGGEVEEETNNEGAEQRAPQTMAPATLVGKLAQSASQERAAVLEERSAALDRV